MRANALCDSWKSHYPGEFGHNGLDCSSVQCPLVAGHREGIGLNVGVPVFCSRTGSAMTVSWKPAKATVDTASPSNEARSAVRTLLGWAVNGPLSQVAGNGGTLRSQGGCRGPGRRLPGLATATVVLAALR